MSTQQRFSLILALGVALTVLTSCGGRSGDRHFADGSALSVSLPEASLPAVSIAATGAGQGVGGAGSVTLSMTAPAAISGYVETTVDCTIGRSYRASVASASINGTSVSFDVMASRYKGSGAYNPTVSLSIVGVDGTTTSVGALPLVPAQLDDSGGSISVNTASAEGRALAIQLTWRCS
jgi:hypothetical protein